MGTYRGLTHVPDALDSIERYVTGIDELVFIDDSGDSAIGAWLSRHGTVHPYPRLGFAHTMKVACELMAAEPCAGWWEEDFTAIRPIDFTALAALLDADPSLAQIALLRQVWYEEEEKAGGILPFLDARPHPDVPGLCVQQRVFTTNPGVWAPCGYAGGWPQSPGSEHLKTLELLADDRCFAYLDGQAVHHAGERTGHGY